LPGFGLCAITWPFRTLLDTACLIFPAEQKCALSARFAAERLLPLTFGTTQFLRVNFAVAFCAALAVTLQAALPLHAPDQSANVEPPAAFSLRVTTVPNG